MSDIFTDALNAPAGQLAGVLLKKFVREVDGVLPAELQARLDKLVDAPGRFGLLGRVRLACDVPFLFDHAPQWTTRKLLPIFDWSSPEAAFAWSSRKYSRWIGSPELFGLLKKPFFEIFERTDVPAEEMGKFADWLVAILIANKSRAVGYPLTGNEARGLLRRAGPEAMASVGHRLAMELGSATPAERAERWRSVVGPVFQAIWPIDVDLQTSATTFKLVQILLATGDAFPEAADIIIPFIRPEEKQAHTTVYSITKAPIEYFQAAPAKVLDLLVAVVGDPPPGSVYMLGGALSRLKEVAPDLVHTRKFQKLRTYASPQA
jgi:hypothetical protein